MKDIELLGGPFDGQLIPDDNGTRREWLVAELPPLELFTGAPTEEMPQVVTRRYIRARDWRGQKEKMVWEGLFRKP